MLFFFCAYLACRPLISGEAAGLGTNSVLVVLIATALLLWVLRSVLDGGFEVVLSGLELPALAFLLIACAASFWAADRFHAFVRSGFWAADLAAFWLALQYSRSAPAARLLLRVVLASALVVAAYGLYQYGWGLDQMRKEGEKLLPGVSPDMVTVFKARLYSNRIFSTFVLANSLGGYLVLVLPLFLVIVLRARSWLARTASGLALACVAVALLLTGSKGSWLALLFALSAGALLLAREIAARPRAALAGGLALALVAGTGLLAAWRVGPFARIRAAMGDAFPTREVLSKTSGVRLGYWKAAGQIAREHPLRGVGPDNFAAWYHTYRESAAGETKRAHNNYLQVAAETGGLGLAAFLAIWIALGLVLWRSRGTGEAPQERRETEVIQAEAISLYALVGVGSFLFLYLMGRSFDAPAPEPGSRANYEAVAYILAGLVWLCTWWLARPSADRWAVRALAIGLVAFLLHGAVDFDLYVQGVSALAFAAAGLACGMVAWHEGRAPRVLRLPIALQIALAVLCLPPFYLLTNNWLMRSVRAERRLETAQEHLRGGTPGAAVPELVEALQQVPWDYGPRHQLAQVYLDGALKVLDVEAYYRGGGQSALHSALGELAECNRANPRYAAAWADRGRALEHFARLHVKSAASYPEGDRERKSREEIGARAFREAEEHYRTAVSLYPHKPAFNFYLGALLVERGKALEGRKHLARALALHGERDKADPIRLPKDVVERIQKELQHK